VREARGDCRRRTTHQRERNRRGMEEEEEEEEEKEKERICSAGRQSVLPD
jgi:hypothetical protein